MGTFRDMINKLEAFQENIDQFSKKAVSIVPDLKGMIDKQCPKIECQSYFKINIEDWKNIARNEEVFCPFCRNTSPSIDYFPPEQRKAAVKSIKEIIMDDWHHGISMLDGIASVSSKEEFELNIQCEKCNARFSVIGAAIFCPCCGYNSVDRTASEAIEKIILQMEKVELIKSGFEKSFDKDETAIFIKSIIENSLTDCVSILQSFCESKYNYLSISKAPFNVFQNIERGNKLWIDLKGVSFSTWLSTEEYNNLIIFTQRRHLLEHINGIIDAKYLAITRDVSYSIGQKVIVNPSDVIHFGKIVLKIIDKISVL